MEENDIVGTAVGTDGKVPAITIMTIGITITIIINVLAVIIILDLTIPEIAIVKITDTDGHGTIDTTETFFHSGGDGSYRLQRIQY